METSRGIARNLFRESKTERLSGSEVPQQGSGRSPVGVWDAKPPEAEVFSTKMFGILIAR